MKRFGPLSRRTSLAHLARAARTAWIALIALIVLGAPFAGTAPAGAQAAPGTPPAGTATPAPQSAPVLEPYRFNARERTARALAAWEKGRPEESVAPLDSALRLQPGDPLVQYNAGTAHLGASHPDAAQLLEQAAKQAPPELAADAFFNLGNARLGTKDARGAIEAYKSSLRAQADQPGAKRNLELALRLLDEQQRQQEEQKKKKDSQEKKKQEGGANPSPQQGGGEEQQDPQQPSQPSQPDQQQDPPQPGDGQPQQGQPPPAQPPEPAQDRPLPQFQDQQDMTAEQAAAILQAVENLERQQRRDQARALARAKTSVEKDW